jgi:diaminohydroxyphosphoribosylaminopyrimidine deaminase/5-amino-6-(5-phosphoribosylamino)uracil reductase
MDHEFYMQKAIEAAENGRWRTAPNPVVGAVLVRGGQIVSQGWHERFGGPHAEVNCIRDAAQQGGQLDDCTLYVTLEPCNHQGKQPPCTRAILDAGIRHVVMGMEDVNKTAAGGKEFLREHGVTVESGVLEEKCRDLVSDFIIWQLTARPYMILKMASTLDGRIAAGNGKPEIITGEASRAEVMRYRKNIGIAGGAVLIGGNTFYLDDPQLTARIEGAEKQPLAAVVTSRLPSPERKCRLVDERAGDCVFFTTAAQAASPAAAVLRDKGARVHVADRAAGGKLLDLKQVAGILRKEEHCPYVYCEGGGRIALALLEDHLVDELHMHLAPAILGDADAKPVFYGRAVSGMRDALRMKVFRTSVAGGDIHLYFRPEED